MITKRHPTSHKAMARSWVEARTVLHERTSLARRNIIATPDIFLFSGQIPPFSDIETCGQPRS